MNEKELSELFEKILNSQLSEGEISALGQKLQDNPQFRKQYAYYAAMYSELKMKGIPDDSQNLDHFKKSRSPTIFPPITDPDSSPAANDWINGIPPWGTFLILVAMLASVVVLAVLTNFSSVRNPDPNLQVIASLQPVAANVPTVAFVEHQAGFWECPGLDAEVGQRLEIGRWLKLRDGWATLQFDNGVELTLFSSTQIQITDSNSVLLISGEARARVPENAIGFTVNSDSGKVVDLGTEFSISKRDEKLEVFVHDGLARVESVESTDSQLLQEGHGVRIDSITGQSEGLRSPSRLTDQSAHSVTGKPVIAFQGLPSVKGNQDYPAKLGHDFDVIYPIEITRLGVFDSESNGLRCPLSCEIWRRPTKETDQTPYVPARRIAAISFAAGQTGELINAHRFLPLDENLILSPGQYSVVAYGYCEQEPNGNGLGFSGQRCLKQRNDGGGLIQFVGTSRFEFRRKRFPGRTTDVDAFPAVPDKGFVDRYLAGTFEFRAYTQLNN